MKRTFMKLSGLLIFASFFFSSCGETCTMSKDELYDKVKGAWAGQTIGCTYGGPTEFHYLCEMVPDSVSMPWSKGEIKRWFDGGGGLFDDLYVDLTFIEAMEKHGMDASPEVFAEAFLSKNYPLCHANQQTRYNLMHGCTPAEAGYWKNNPHANCLDFQIEADFAGIVTPGLVNSASDICDRAGHMLSYGDGWYAGVYVAAMYSMAYVYDDAVKVVEEALKAIPAKTSFHECMSDVIGWYHQNPQDWKWCWQQIQDKWGTTDIACPDGVEMPFNIEVHVNCAYIILGLLYGEGDFIKTVDISTRAGQDSDCNPASSGGIIGTMLGYSKIPAEYVEAMEVVADIPFNHSVSFNKGCEMSYKQALQMIQNNGGCIDGDEVVIKVQKPKAVNYEISFEGIAFDKKFPVENWVANFPETEFEGIGAVIRGHVQGEGVPSDYVALLDVYVDGKVLETCELPFEYNHRKHELFFNYELPEGKHKISCKWTNPIKGVDIWVRDLITYKAK